MRPARGRPMKKASPAAAASRSASRPTATASGPDNAEWQRDLSLALATIGDFKAAAGDIAGAREAFAECLAIRRRLAERNPANADWQRDLAVALRRLGRLDFVQGNASAAA